MLLTLGSRWILGCAAALMAAVVAGAGCASCVQPPRDPVCRDHIFYCALMAKVEKNPRDPMLRFDLGCRLEDSNLWEDALSEFKHVAELDAGHALAHFRAARVAERLMQSDETVAHCQAFIDRVRGETLREETQWCIGRLRQLKNQ